MNTFIETLNQWGGGFLRFVWPMLWQASLLIVILFGLDYLGRRHLRASVRYTLWLVVLVKLCLPPTLALPTSPAWWLHKTAPAITQVMTRHFSVTYDQEAPVETHVNAMPDLTRWPPIAGGAWLLVASITVSAVLLLWLLVRWAQVTRRVRRAANSERLNGLLQETQNLAGLNFSVQAKVTANSMSPAVCGLFRPTVLIPQSLVDTFSDEQLRAVLLHELIHLRRRDVWVNFLQALVQIVYWWHPLVWVANARIRGVREEAVDDTVVLALRDEAENYAPTLLEVAKLALRRPMVSLGLVGIMESRQALRQRIERLLDGRTPHRTGLTLASLLGILAFSAVAVPMGDGPSAASEAAPASTSHQAVLIAAKFYVVPNAGGPDLWFESENSNFKVEEQETFGSFTPKTRAKFETQLRKAKLRPFFSPRVETTEGVEGIVSASDGTNVMKFSCRPAIRGDKVKLAFGAEIPRNAAGAGWPLPEAIISDEVQTRDQGGIYVYKMPAAREKNHLLMIIAVKLLTNGLPETAGESRPPVTSKIASNAQSQADLRVGKELARTPARPQLHIKARFLEVPEGTWDTLEKFPVMSTNGNNAVVGILTRQQQTAQWQKLWRDPKVYNYAEPEVTTTSGRQTQMRATTVFTVITNATYQRDPNGSNSLVFAMESEETGPILEAAASVLADGYTIDLKASPSLAKFLGYDRPVVDSDPPVIVPNVEIRRAGAHVHLWDGQTVAFGKFKKHIYSEGGEAAAKPEYFDPSGSLIPPMKQDTEMLVLITVDIVDAAGNREHSDDQLAFARNGIPEQTGD